MLDAEHAVVADVRQRRDEAAPPALVVTASERDVVPRTRFVRAAGRGVDHAVYAGNRRLDPRVFGMDVIDRVAERTGCREGIGAHPHQVAWIEVGTDRVADRIAQPLERCHAVDVLIAVQLETQVRHALVARIRRQVAPVGNQHVLPLPADDLAHLGWPLGRDPVGVPVAGCAGASRHHDDAIDLQQAREANGLARHVIVPASFVARMHRIARAIERADRNVVVGQLGEKLAARGRAFEHSVQVDMRSARPVSAAELEHVHFQPRRHAEHRVEIGFGQAVGDHSYLHRGCATAWAGEKGRSVIQRPHAASAARLAVPVRSDLVENGAALTRDEVTKCLREQRQASCGATSCMRARTRRRPWDRRTRPM